MAGGGDERSAAAGLDSAVRLAGATGLGGRPQGPAAGGSAPGHQPATVPKAFGIQSRIARCKPLLHMQQRFVMGAGGNGWTATALRFADGKG
jgi:hypothetical protein